VLLLAMLAAACGGVADNPDPSPQPDAPAVCTAETDQAFCSRIAACESVTTADSCGALRTVDIARAA